MNTVTFSNIAENKKLIAEVVSTVVEFEYMDGVTSSLSLTSVDRMLKTYRRLKTDMAHLNVVDDECHYGLCETHADDFADISEAVSTALHIYHFYC